MIQVDERVAEMAGVISAIVYGVMSELVKNGVLIQGTKFIPISKVRLRDDYLPFVSVTTVYRSLVRLVELGLLKQIHRGKQVTWYGLGDDIDDIFKKNK